MPYCFAHVEPAEDKPVVVSMSTGPVIEGADRVGAAYAPDHYERLVALKTTYDSDNFFRLNQNIAPS